MASIEKIQKDELGLYVDAGNWICRPFFGTMFQEGDEVKTHYFGGSTNAGVTFVDKEFTFKPKTGIYETWCTTGILSHEYEKKIINDRFAKFKSWDKYLKDTTDWYKKNVAHSFFIYGKINNEFKNKYEKTK